MALRFGRRRGAVADVKELEYIIALHQACQPDTRENATVSSLGVYRLLKSRYGFNSSFFSHPDAVAIVRALGGGDTVASEDLVKKADAKSNKRRILTSKKESSEEDDDEFFDAIEGDEEKTTSWAPRSDGYFESRTSPPSSSTKKNGENEESDENLFPDGMEEYLE